MSFPRIPDVTIKAGPSDPTSIRFDRPSSVVIAVGAVLQILSMAPIPLLVREIFDDILAPESSDVGRRLLWLGALIVALQIASAVATVAIRSRVADIAAAHGHHVRLWVRDLLLHRSIPSVRGRDDAYLLRAATTLPSRFEDGINAVLGQILPSALVTTAITLVLFWLDWQLAMILVVAFPLLSLAHRGSRKRLQAAHALRSVDEQALMRRSLSMIERLESVRTPRAAEMEEGALSARSESYRQSSGDLVRLRSRVLTANTTAVVMTVTILLLVGGWGIDQGRLSIGEFLAFYAGVAIVRGPAQQLGMAIPQLDSARDARDLLRSLDHELDIVPAAGTQHVALDKGIEFRAIRFGYDNEPVLDGVDLDLKRGTMTALVGPNGAGKTTLMMLLLGLFEPDSGDRSADRQRYETLDLAHMRSHIGVSYQQAELAEASVLDNIVYGREFSAEDISNAVNIAGLEEIIDRLDDGIDTMVGPGGRRLSRGQEQRIALARAAIGQPPVLMLDEPTNHLDPSSVSRLLELLVTQEHAPAILVVSHDHRALELADRVVELRNGTLRDVPASERRSQQGPNGPETL